MSEPEISHRCPSCGAAVRKGDALFCPECGKSLQGTSANPAATQPETSPAPTASEPNNIDENATTATSDAETAIVSPPSQASSPAPSQVEITQVETNASSHPQRFAGKTRETLHRASAVASAAARGVIEEPVKRVEKIRHASTHVIEEASYDPSLRFVLVALGLFVVFVIFLVLSKVMG